MSLTEINITSLVKRQYGYKLKGLLGAFLALIVVQLLAMVFSSNGTMTMSSGADDYSVSVNYYSGDLIIIFTMIWALIISVILTTKAYRNDDFIFVTNRLSSNLANIVFLITASVVGGISAMLSSVLLKVFVFYVFNTETLIAHNDLPIELFIGVVSTAFYLLLLTAIGYFFGTLAQVNKWLLVVIPLVFVSIIVLQAALGEFLYSVFRFFVQESSLSVFCIKVLITVVILFSSATILSNRIEVRKS